MDNSTVSPAQLTLGPQPLAREDRLSTINDIVAAIRAEHGEAVLAIGLYGSMARGSDEAYSDIEMLCVLDTEGDDYTYEWVYGPGKAEVNFQSRAAALAHAGELEDDWPLTHGSYLNLKCLYGSERVLAELRGAVWAHTEAEFDKLIAEIIVGDVYEYIGKLRNARLSGSTDYIPTLAFEMVQQCALLIGLGSRLHYTTNSTLLAESLARPNRPQGYDALARRVMRGELADSETVAAEMERLWAGVVDWAVANKVGLETRRRHPFA